MAARARRTGRGSVDSRSSATCASTTTPVAPPATAAAAVWRPMPPWIHTGRSVRASTCWPSTNAPVVPARPPLSAPRATSPSAPAASAARASSAERTSATSRRGRPSPPASPAPAQRVSTARIGGHYGVSRAGEVAGAQRAAEVDAHAERGVRAGGHEGERLPGPGGVHAEVEHAEGARAGRGDDDPRRRLAERCLHPHEILFALQRSTDEHAASPCSPWPPCGHCGPDRAVSATLLTSR